VSQLGLFTLMQHRVQGQAVIVSMDGVCFNQKRSLAHCVELIGVYIPIGCYHGAGATLRSRRHLGAGNRYTGRWHTRHDAWTSGQQAVLRRAPAGRSMYLLG
jgi:hypothetical protein